jgi:type IX secretion system PorP/SprF family membrane protein
VAQLSPMKSQYFANPYLVNPSMAARDGRMSLYSNVSSQLTLMPGSPQMLSVSGSLPLNNKASVGLNIIGDKSGLLKRNQVLGSFAYRIPVSENQDIRFGVSLAVTQDRLDNSTATSNGMNDPTLANYNDMREANWDGNFGVAYTSGKLEAQFSYLNLNQKRSERFSTVDYSTFYSSLAYQFDLDTDFRIKPLIAFRGVNNYRNQWDAAIEWGVFSKGFNLYTMYHSNKSFTGGFAFEHKSKLLISGYFNSEPKQLSGLTGGIFDLVLGYKF